jgi:hypothetical protein
MIHIVLQGECVSSLAARFGLMETQIFDDPANAELKKRREYGNILAPDDQLTIPPVSEKYVAVATGKRHYFKRGGRNVMLRIVLLNSDDEPYAGKRFIVTVGTQEMPGHTTGQGLIEVAVPAQAESGWLRVWLTDGTTQPQIDRALEIGHLDPINITTGVQARLENLGYPCTVTAEVDLATIVAALQFRAKNDLPKVDLPPAQTDESKETDQEPRDEMDENSADDPRGMIDAKWEAAMTNTDMVEKIIDDAFRTKLQALYEKR